MPTSGRHWHAKWCWWSWSHTYTEKVELSEKTKSKEDLYGIRAKNRKLLVQLKYGITESTQMYWRSGSRYGFVRIPGVGQAVKVWRGISASTSYQPVTHHRSLNELEMCSIWYDFRNSCLVRGSKKRYSGSSTDLLSLHSDHFCLFLSSTLAVHIEEVLRNLDCNALRCLWDHYIRWNAKHKRWMHTTSTVSTLRRSAR